METMGLETQPTEEEGIPMVTKLQEIEEAVALEKEKSKNCRSAIRKSIDSLCELLNGEELSEEEKVETPEPIPSLGGTDVKPE